MNIGFFTDTYLPQINGVVTSIETFRRELVNAGHNVFVFGPKMKSSKEDMEYDKENQIYRCYSIPYPRQKEHRIVFPVSRKFWNFKKFNLDVIHSHTYFPMGIYAAYLAKRFRIPLIHTYHTLWAEYTHYSFLPKRPTQRAVITWSRQYCNYCDYVISPSSAIRDVLLQYGITKPIGVLPTGIDVEDFRSKPGFDIRSRFNISPEEKILSFVGRLGKEKNMGFLFNAFKQVLAVMPQCRFLVVGDGPEKKDLVKLAAELKIADKILFTGYMDRSEVMGVLAASDLFLFASRTETQGLSLIEAMTVGTPAVVVNAMGAGEILAGNRGGLLAEPEVNDFALKTLRMLQEPELYREKEAETSIVVNDFSAANITRKLIEIYDETVKNHRHDQPRRFIQLF